MSFVFAFEMLIHNHYCYDGVPKQIFLGVTRGASELDGVEDRDGLHLQAIPKELFAS